MFASLFKNPEASFRYLPILSDLKKRHQEDQAILEVGGGDFNLSNFWSVPLTVADVSFNHQVENQFVTKVAVDGPILPFKNVLFDYSVSLDTLEHVPTENRELFLKEVARVTQKVIYLGFPSGIHASKQDLDLLKIAPENKSAFLKEHVKNGLPEVDDVTTILNGVGFKLVAHSSNLNLGFRRLLMRLWLQSDNLFVWKIFFKLSGFLAPFYRLLSCGECYRQILVFEKSL